MKMKLILGPWKTLVTIQYVYCCYIIVIILYYYINSSIYLYKEGRKQVTVTFSNCSGAFHHITWSISADVININKYTNLHLTTCQRTGKFDKINIKYITIPSYSQTHKSQANGGLLMWVLFKGYASWYSLFFC